MKVKPKAAIANDSISVLELKLLLESIADHHANVRIKFLLDDGEWTDQFLSVMIVTERGLVLNDDTINKIISIQFLSQVIQFVLDKPFDNYNADLAYAVNAINH